MKTEIGIILICLKLLSLSACDKFGPTCITLDHGQAFFVSCAEDLTIRDYTFLDYSHFQHVDIEFHSISGHMPSLILHSRSLTPFHKLTNLTIRRAQISFAHGHLAPYPSLKELVFLGCGFTEVPTRVLEFARNLDKLSFAENRIRIVKRHSFHHLGHLKRLNLAWNRIHTLEYHCFDGLHNLTELNLSYNDFAVIPGIFHGLNQLNVLDLTRAILPKGYDNHDSKVLLFFTNVTILQPGMFDGTPQLRYLKLDRNPIKNIPYGVFNNLKLLTELSLSTCGLETIEPGAFSGLNLMKLDLSGTTTERIVAEVFEAAKFGGVLPFRNHILKIQPRTFDNLTVSFLDMSFNYLIIIGSEDFFGLDVNELNLSGNMIIKIAPDAFDNTKVNKLRLDNSSRLLSNHLRLLNEF